MAGSDEHPWHGVPIILTPHCPRMAGAWDALNPDTLGERSPGVSCSGELRCISLLASLPHQFPMVTELPLSSSPHILVSPLLLVSLERGKRQHRLDGPEEKWEWEDLEHLQVGQLRSGEEEEWKEVRLLKTAGSTWKERGR